MLTESIIKIGYDSMFNLHQANFKSAHLLKKMVLVQSQSGRTVAILVVFLGLKTGLVIYIDQKNSKSFCDFMK